jgi:cytochrome c553
MKKLAIALISLPLVAFSGAALAADHGAGKDQADACLDCHEPDDFAGSSAAEIEQMIRDAIAGTVKHGPEIKDLAEEDIAAVAAWFAHEGGN